MNDAFPTIIHERIDSARNGKNRTVITRLRSGWAVLGDNQILPGYCLLLHDPVVETLNALSADERTLFLNEMTIIGDAIMEVMNPILINYSILGNTDRALHAHIHPRYAWEKEEFRKGPPFLYSVKKERPRPFDYETDRELLDALRAAILKRMPDTPR